MVAPRGTGGHRGTYGGTAQRSRPPVRRPRRSGTACAAGVETSKSSAGKSSPEWWTMNSAPNMVDVGSTVEFVDALANAGDKLVVADFYATWCGACRALYPKLCQIATKNPDVIFLKVNLAENKKMCKQLGVKMLPYFHLYRGRRGKIAQFTCSISKVKRLRDAISEHTGENWDADGPLRHDADVTAELAALLSGEASSVSSDPDGSGSESDGNSTNPAAGAAPARTDK